MIEWANEKSARENGKKGSGLDYGAPQLLSQYNKRSTNQYHNDDPYIEYNHCVKRAHFIRSSNEDESSFSFILLCRRQLQSCNQISNFVATRWNHDYQKWLYVCLLAKMYWLVVFLLRPQLSLALTIRSPINIHFYAGPVVIILFHCWPRPSSKAIESVVEVWYSVPIRIPQGKGAESGIISENILPIILRRINSNFVPHADHLGNSFGKKLGVRASIIPTAIAIFHVQPKQTKLHILTSQIVNYLLNRTLWRIVATAVRTHKDVNIDVIKPRVPRPICTFIDVPIVSIVTIKGLQDSKRVVMMPKTLKIWIRCTTKNLQACVKAKSTKRWSQSRQ